VRGPRAAAGVLELAPGESPADRLRAALGKGRRRSGAGRPAKPPLCGLPIDSRRSDGVGATRVASAPVVAVEGLTFAFTVPGPPQPKERARRGANGRWYTPERTKRYEAAVRELMTIHAPRGWPADATYVLEVVGYFPDARARDGDNLAKSVSDAGNKCLWRDDSQVVRMIVEKRLDRENPRTEVIVRVL